MSADISSDTSRSTYRPTLDRYVERYVGRLSVDMSTDMSVEGCTKYTWSDRSLPLFLLHILPLCDVWQHLNTCASRVIQVYASHAIALNKSRPKILARVSLNANCFNLYLLQAVCCCLHLVICLWLKSSTLLFYSEERHCLCTVPTCHICIIACLILSTEVSNIKKVCARSLLVKIRLQVKMNLFSVMS